MTSMSSDDININPDMLNYMNSILAVKVKTDERKDQLFDPSELPVVNSGVRNNNYYMLDKYGLVIRKDFQNNKKSAFGWRYNSDNEPINIHIDNILLQTNSNNIRDITLQQLKHHYPSLFNPPRGVIYKIYSTTFPDINLDNI